MSNITDGDARLVLRIVKRRVQHHAKRNKGVVDSEDLESALQLSIAQRLISYDPSRSSLATFVERCLDTAIVDFWRHRNAESRGGGEVPKSLGVDANVGDASSRFGGRTASSIRCEINIDVNKVIEGLDPDDRHLCELIRDDHSVAEAANQLEIHRGTAHRRLEKLRRIFEDKSLRDYLK